MISSGNPIVDADVQSDCDHGDHGKRDTGSTVRDSSFFVGVADTPRTSDVATSGASIPRHSHAHAPLVRALTVGAQSDYHIDYVGGGFPRVRISLIWRRVVAYVATLSAALLAFCAIAYRGIAVDSAGSVDVANAISGLLMAFFELLLGLVMQQILSVNLVYLHNALWLTHNSTVVSRTSRALRSFVLVLFPVLMMLLVTNSLRSLQASKRTADFESIMSSGDLVRRTEPASSNEPTFGILQNAITGASVPFQIQTTSACSAGTRSKTNSLRLNIHDFDTTNVVYGFATHAWNAEALSTPLKFDHQVTYNSTSTSPNGTTDGFDLGQAFNMYMHGKILLDKGMATGSNASKPCEASTNDTRCNVMKDTLVDIGQARQNTSLQTPENLLHVVGFSLASLVTYFDPSTVTIHLQRHTVTPLIQLEMMTVEGASPLGGQTISVENSSVDVFKFGDTTSDLCGAHDCVLIDQNDRVHVPQQTVVLPSYTNCSLSEDGLEYSSDLRLYKPKSCQQDQNAFVVVSSTTFVSGDEYGDQLSSFDGSTPEKDDGAYIVNPHRILRMVVARYSWTPQKLEDHFNASCNISESSGGCQGIYYRLPGTGQFVFAGENALPMKRVNASSFASPHRLVQLNPAQLFLASNRTTKVPERLDRHAGQFAKVRWSKEGFSGTNCSRLVDSYVSHVEANGFFMDRSPSFVYRTGLFFLLSGGVVTKPANQSQSLAGDALAFVRLHGDIQLSAIRVSVPLESFSVAVAGCLGLILLAAVVLVVPSRRREYFPAGTSPAAKYIALQNPSRYPIALYRKTLLFPATNEALPVHEFAVDELRLAHKETRERQIVLS